MRDSRGAADQAPTRRQPHESCAGGSSRSLERELGLLAEERKDRARQLGIEIRLVSTEIGK